STGRQIARGAVAEPATAQADVHVFGYRKFPPRATQIVSVAPGVSRDRERVDKPPAVCRQQFRVTGHAVNVHGHLERYGSLRREMEEAQPPRALRPVKGLALVGQVPPLRVPLPNRGIGTPGTTSPGP